MDAKIALNFMQLHPRIILNNIFISVRLLHKIVIFCSVVDIFHSLFHERLRRH